MATPGKSEETDVSELAWKTVGGILLRMQLDLDRPWTLHEAARVAGYEQHHFASMFRQVVGTPPARYLRLLRLERAAYQLLQDSRTPVMEIAAAAGYQTGEAFSRAFRRATGDSPRAFRQRGEKRSERATIYARPSPRSRPPLVTVEGLDPHWQVEVVGPLYGWTLRVGLEPAAYPAALARLIQARPPDGPWQLGGLAFPFGWIGGAAKDIRVVRFVDNPTYPPPPMLAWRLPPVWMINFKYTGQVSRIAGICSWIVGTWLPNAGLRHAFGPVISRLEGPPSSTGVARVKLHVPAHNLSPAFRYDGDDGDTSTK